MKKQRILTLTVAFVLLLSVSVFLFACGNQTDDAEQSDAVSEQASETATASDTTDTSNTQETVPSPNPSNPSNPSNPGNTNTEDGLGDNPMDITVDVGQW